ncbi:VOC family protein [Vagococcus vulneris]|uniref:VOC domain-containing protein n=1 Tax=Vagococcus vulneris TaxID=1977869 RepID=A0A429ZY02_9ENTE|nr:VOC family protein [Vagococcus vulneris]RST98788.1 hypothetical protein CBF37_07000 [Vagococcus vulneris]
MERFSLDPEIKLSSVAIKVKDLDKMENFYRHIIGLDLINEENDMALMGLGQEKKKLLGLVYSPEADENLNQGTGLNHMAFVFPEREQLGSFIHHLFELNYPIDGESDHGYCEAIYITDPEGNRIAFVWDKPQEKWPVADGKIHGVTKPLDLRKVTKNYSETYQHIPKDTKVGYVHLSVANLDESYDFYTNLLGFTLKDNDFSNMHYLSLNQYHHHIALDSWTPSSYAPSVQDDELGVDHVTFSVPNYDSLVALRNHLTAHDADLYFNKGKQIIGINDPNGIQLWFRVFPK